MSHFFDSNHDNAALPSSPQIAVQFDSPTAEISTIPGTIRESTSEIFPQADRSYVGTDAHRYMDPDAVTSVEQHNPTPTNPRSIKFDICHNPRPICIADYKF